MNQPLSIFVVGTELGSDLKQAFLSHLPERIRAVENDWDILVRGSGSNRVEFNRSLQRIQGMAGAAGKYGLIQISENLHALEQYFRTLIGRDEQPTDRQVEQVNALILNLKRVSTDLKEPAGGAVLRPKDKKSRIFYLDFDEAAAPGLAGVLENSNCSVLHPRRLQDLLQEYENGPPDVIVADSRLLQDIGPLTEKLKGIKSEQGSAPPLVVVSTSNDLSIRLDAIRSGAEAFFAIPLDERAVAARIKQMAARKSDVVFRVLVVDDDPSQADFAAAILRKVDMETRTVTDPLRVLHALDTFRPNLILMDLYMPGADGKELTAIIRDQIEFVGIPIIFVSGEQDADKQLDALSAGADDFIAKPIRPRHLIATIKNRVQRIQALRGQLQDQSRRDPVTHLFNRRHFFEYLENMLVSVTPQTTALGLLIAELDHKDAMQTQIGGNRTNTLLAEIGALIAAQVEPQDLVARIDHNSFAVLAKRPVQRNLLELAQDLVQIVKQTEFEKAQTQPTLSLGVCCFNVTSQDAGELVTQASNACRKARSDGGNRVEHLEVLVAPTSGTSPPHRDTLTLVQDALREGSFQVQFQPYLNTQDKKREIYQMLPRLRLDDGEQMQASEFMPVARQANLARGLDRWLTGHAMEIMDQRRNSGNEVRLLVAQGGATLGDTRCTQDLRDALRQRLLVGTGLILEFDLVDVANNLKRAPALAQELRNMGVEICLARFSHNEASYKILNVLRAAYVKVAEKSLTADSGIIDALIQRGHQLGAKIIVPQVDDPRLIGQQWLACADLVQGNAFQGSSQLPDFDFPQP